MSDKIILDEVPITGTVRDLPQVRIVRVNNSSREAMWNHMVREYHYLGYPDFRRFGPKQTKKCCFWAMRFF